MYVANIINALLQNLKYPISRIIRPRKLADLSCELVYLFLFVSCPKYSKIAVLSASLMLFIHLFKKIEGDMLQNCEILLPLYSN